MRQKLIIFVLTIVRVIPSRFKIFLRSNKRSGGDYKISFLYHPLRLLEFLFMARKNNAKLANVYFNMISRCYYIKNISYKNYGGRGISVCDEWRNDINLFIKWSIENGYQEGDPC